jgi:putative ABC transport system permease protein
MIAPRWRKVGRDLLGHPGRSLLAVLALATGVFQVGALVHEYAILDPLLGTMYSRTRPASAILFTDGAGDDVVEAVRRVSGVAQAEARPIIMARVRVRASAGPGGREWMPAVLSVIRDFTDLRTDTFRPNDGAWPPGAGEILLERSALGMSGVGTGDTLTLRNPSGDETTLRLAGSVHAAGLAPAWMDHVVPGFVPWDSTARAALGGESAQIRIVVAGHPLDEGYVREVAAAAKAAIEARGHTVSRVGVENLGKHPHADQMSAFMYLLGVFGILSLVLSAALVAGMVQALLAEQMRQVGVMKAIGASTRQIAGLYLGQVAILALAALAVGLPIGLAAGRAYAGFAAGILNVDVNDAPFPTLALLAVIAVGLLLPLLVAIGPIHRAARITVHQALGDDLGPRPFGSRRSDRLIAGVTWLPRPLLLSLRTACLRRGRLALTVGTLAIGGAVFMSALNVSGAWNRAVDEDFGSRRYDLMVTLGRAYPVATLDPLFAAVPGVIRAESWPGASPYLIGAEGVAGGTVALVGPGPDSTLLDLPLLAGRWLRPDDHDAAVINQMVVVRNPALRVGGVVQLRIDDRTISFPIVGVVRELNPVPVVYAPSAAVIAATGQSGDSTRLVRIVTAAHDDAAQRDAAARLETALREHAIEVSGITRMLDARKAILDHLVIVKAILTLAALIVVIVGGIGLTSSLTLSVVRRTREIGILGAIGATPRAIACQVWAEGVAIGIASWVVALLLAAPASAVLESATGRIFFKAPLGFFVSAGAGAIWLVLVVVIASLSSFFPARRAARLSVREALAYA